MKIELFTALKTLNLSDEKAKEVVEAVEEHIAVKINEATKGLEAQNKALEAQLKAQTWVIGSVGFILAVIALAPAFAKIFD